MNELRESTQEAQEKKTHRERSKHPATMEADFLLLFL